MPPSTWGRFKCENHPITSYPQSQSLLYDLDGKLRGRVVVWNLREHCNCILYMTFNTITSPPPPPPLSYSQTYIASNILVVSNKSQEALSLYVILGADSRS